MASSPNSETEVSMTMEELSLSDTTSNSSSASICPHCCKNIDFPPQDGSQIYPTKIQNSHLDFETFKQAANAALKGQFEGVEYDEARALLLNWKANDIGLKASEAGSLIIDETHRLEKVLKDLYRFDTEYFPIPSENPPAKVQKLLADAIAELSDKRVVEKWRVLLIVYYNGHGAVKDGKLIWSA